MVFNAKIIATQLYSEKQAYIQTINLFNIPRNKKKDCYGMEILIFGIEIDTFLFTAKLSQNKLEKAIKKTGKALSNSSKSIFYLDIQSLVGYLSFCSQAVYLKKVFIRRL